MNVSIIIPAFNATETISETLQSVLAQTLPDWEAVVVDDGSSDDTAAIVQGFARRDGRIRCVSQPRSGVSAARNAGISLARHEWLLFLDADDLLLPRHLKLLTDRLNSDPLLDAAYCGYARMNRNGRTIGEWCGHPPDDLFKAFARYCVFAIHTCILRKSIVEAVGRFDESLRTCEDWDLWQRVVRSGARFAAIQEVLAYYRTWPHTLSTHALIIFSDGLRVITQGHASDPRVPVPAPAYMDGSPKDELPRALFNFACWAAGLMMGKGEDTVPLLDKLAGIREPTLDAVQVASLLAKAVLISTAHGDEDWPELWPVYSRSIAEFLHSLERHSQTRGLANCATLALERLIIGTSNITGPVTIGASHAVQMEITEPLRDITTPQSVERLYCAVAFDGNTLGLIELPVFGGVVPGYIIADAIAAEFFWPILGGFFEKTVYHDLRIRSLYLTEKTFENDRDFWTEIHRQLGWTVFLQEIWDRRDWPNERFYDATAEEQNPKSIAVANGWFLVEVSEEIPDLEVSGSQLKVVLTVGGVAIGVVDVAVRQNRVYAQELRAALYVASGLELCIAAVREGIIGKPLTGNGTLRERLSAASEATKASGPPDAPGVGRYLNEMVSSGERVVVLCRRKSNLINTSVSRCAMLPVSAADELIDSAGASGEYVIHEYNSDKSPTRVIYSPDVIPSAFLETGLTTANEKKDETGRVMDLHFYDRRHFEEIFARQPDPWTYTSPYEQTKYEQTLMLLPQVHIGRALELACAEGHFTVQLAPRVERLVAADISRIALDRAAERCAGLKNVGFENLDFVRDPLPGEFDLIVCSEVLYYAGSREALRTVASKFAEALEQGGYILIAHAYLVADEPDRTGFDWDLPFGAKIIGETFANIPALCLVKELRTPLYRIQLFQSIGPSSGTVSPEIIEFDAQPTPLLPEVAAHVLWNGGLPKRWEVSHSIVTERLPILMYHRVAPSGAPTLKRYRVTPAAFEEQLRYLSESGYYSIGLEDWRQAVEKKIPLPGKAVLITFDDGYLDFMAYAWPLLKRYNFSATVFLVSGLIGQENTWDRSFGDEVPLLGWKEILQLQEEGVEFGSHGNSHCPLSSLSAAEVVKECARSRAILAKGLGRQVISFAYPHGDENRMVQQLIGACGFLFGLSCRAGHSSLYDPLLSLPRIEVTGSENFQDFVLKLESG